MDLFRVTTRSDNLLRANTEGDPRPEGQHQTPALITFESLAAPALAGAVGVLWAALQLLGGWTADIWVPFALAALVLLLFWLNKLQEYEGWHKATAAFGIALINAVLVASSVVGIQSAANTVAGPLGDEATQPE